MKIEWRKDYKDVYLPKSKPVLIDIAKYKYFTIAGVGDPNGDDFAKDVEILYSLSYGIKMLPKKGTTPDGYFDYAVFPLEGVWSVQDGVDTTDKSKYQYTIMIRQPEFVTTELAQSTITEVQKKKKDLDVNKAKFEQMMDGLSVQSMHIGSYDDEIYTFKIMDDFLIANRLVRTNKMHKEIYISDPRKTAQDKLKTVLRYQVKNG